MKRDELIMNIVAGILLFLVTAWGIFEFYKAVFYQPEPKLERVIEEVFNL